MDPQEYDNIQLVYAGRRSRVLRATRLSDRRPVILKVPAQGGQSRDTRQRMQHEFEIGSSITGPDTVPYLCLESHEDGLAIVMEDVQGVSLRGQIPVHGMPLLRCVELAVDIAERLGRIHKANVIHMDIKPDNILVDPSGAARFCDFGLSCRLDMAADSFEAQGLGGTIAYISPEQTGRTNHPIDHRSDLYSFGVTLYEMLTGALPFSAGDALEMVHCHIARRPMPPLALRPEIPGVLSDIVLKLLSKNPGDRYRSARGLRHDLERCAQCLRAGDPMLFSLGERDVSARLLLADGFYGREQEMAVLLDAFQQAAAGSTQLVLVRGTSGVGKSTLIHELQGPVLERRGSFCYGKFEELKRDIPLSAVTTALRGLIREILTEQQASVEAWRNRILDAVSHNGRLLIDAVPELEAVIGPQPAPPDLGPAESEMRFRWVSRSFIAALAQEERPLVIFLDDLQWADDASLKLLEGLMTDGQARFLLWIGAYRDNEIDASHPLMLARAAMENSQSIREIALEPLDLAGTSALIARTLQQSPTEVADLAALVHMKTRGNPFFLREFLKALYREGLLTVDEERGRWAWQIAKIEDKGFSDDVLDLLASEIHKLSPSAQRMLSLAACIGNHFGMGELAIVSEKDTESLLADLREALRSGLILPVGTTAGGTDAGVTSRVGFRFVHDRVQQVAYSLIAGELRAEVHTTIGRLLLRSASEREREERAFDIASHLNHGIHLIDSSDERLALAELNHIAARKAKAANAYLAAMAYLDTAFSLLGPRPWQQHYARALAVRRDHAEAACLAGDYATMDVLLQDAFSHAQQLLEKIPFYRVRIDSLTARNRMLEALESAIDVLGLLGVKLPKRPTKVQIVLGLGQMKLRLWGKTCDDFLALPVMTDERHLAAMRLLSGAVTPSWMAMPNMFALLAFEMVRLSLASGHCAYSIHGYSALSCVFSVAEDVESAELVDEIANRLVDQLHAPELRSKALLHRGTFVMPLRHHIRDTLELLLEGYRSGVNHGDAEAAVLSTVVHAWIQLMAGVPLAEVVESFQSARQVAKRFAFVRSVTEMNMAIQFTRNLLDEAEDASLIKGPEYDETQALEKHLANHDRESLNILLYVGAWLAYLRRDLHRARQRIQLESEHIEALTGSVYVQAFHFLHGIILLQSEDGDFAERRRRRQTVKKILKRYTKWAAAAPMNYQHRLHLLLAEEARASGDRAECMAQYDRSIALADKHKHLHEEAMACELAARFYLGIGYKDVAATHLGRARRQYAAWGSTLKVRQLDKEFAALLGVSSTPVPEPPLPSGPPPSLVRLPNPASVSLLPTSLAPGALGALLTVAESGQWGASALDLATLLQASRALSEEIVLDALLRKLIRMLVQNAGAERGLLILEKAGELVIEVESVVGKADVIVHQGAPADAERLPVAILSYVARTKESVVLEDAAAGGLFANDPYIRTHRPQSVLCAPLINRGKLIAIAYMENSLAAGAFTADRLEVLKLLSAHAALSIHNARLYSNLEKTSEHLRILNEQLEEYNRTLEQKVAERTRELQEKNEELLRTQKQLVTQEKLASLGALTAGIAHEIKNPLNFVNNFAELTVGLADDLATDLGAVRSRIDPDTMQDIEELLDAIQQNSKTIEKHGKRADQIIKGMLLHARNTTSTRAATDLHYILTESVNLVTSGMRAKDPGFDLAVHTDYDRSIGPVYVVAPDLSRVFTNVITNACYATAEKKKNGAGSDYRPELRVATQDRGEYIEIRIRDNGTGIPAGVLEKIYHPFFTTKPPGEGTGLGLSITHDIIVDGHQGQLRVETAEGDFTEFIITLPKLPRLAESKADSDAMQTG